MYIKKQTAKQSPYLSFVEREGQMPLQTIHKTFADFTEVTLEGVWGAREFKRKARSLKICGIYDKTVAI
jgi:hypothetical protein